MRFTPTELQGAFVVEPTPAVDERGSFARIFCEREFGEHGLQTRFVQHSRSESVMRGTLRGMHFQLAPHAEVKVVSCQRGAMFDVIIDLRPESPTYRRWIGVELTPYNQRQLYIPAGFAHGFQTLADDTVTNYLISEFYVPQASVGVRFDDPAFGITWPMAPTTMSDKDRAWPLLAETPA
jgi:dTDP-4-dehydrorhamnose 3,5-epimerase